MSYGNQYIHGQSLTKKLAINALHEKYISDLKATAPYILKESHFNQKDKQSKLAKHNIHTNDDEVRGESSRESLTKRRKTTIVLKPQTSVAGKIKDKVKSGKVRPTTSYPKVTTKSHETLIGKTPSNLKGNSAMPKRSCKKKKSKVGQNKFIEAAKTKVEFHLERNRSALKSSPMIRTDKNVRIGTRNRIDLKIPRPKVLPPLQPWKPGKVPDYNFHGRLTHLNEMLENAIRCNSSYTLNGTLNTGQKDIPRQKESSSDVTTKHSIYGPGVREGDCKLKKLPRRPWTKWCFKTQWPMPY